MFVRKFLTLSAAATAEPTAMPAWLQAAGYLSRIKANAKTARRINAAG
jgi:hypothetical protein